MGLAFVDFYFLRYAAEAFKTLQLKNFLEFAMLCGLCFIECVCDADWLVANLIHIMRRISCFSFSSIQTLAAIMQYNKIEATASSVRKETWEVEVLVNFSISAHVSVE